MIPERNHYELNPPEDFIIDKPTPDEWLEESIIEHEQDRYDWLMFDYIDELIKNEEPKSEPVSF